MIGEQLRTERLLVCGLCDEGPQIRTTDDVCHCPTCGSLMRTVPVPWDEGEIGPDTENLIGSSQFHD